MEGAPALGPPVEFFHRKLETFYASRTSITLCLAERHHENNIMEEQYFQARTDLNPVERGR